MSTLSPSLAAVFVVCLSGCTTAVAPAPKAPRTASLADERAFVLPYGDMAPPGSMDVSWEPTAEATPETIVPRKLVAKPELVSTEGKRHLFVLPKTSFQH